MRTKLAAPNRCSTDSSLPIHLIHLLGTDYTLDLNLSTVKMLLVATIQVFEKKKELGTEDTQTCCLGTQQSLLNSFQFALYQQLVEAFNNEHGDKIYLLLGISTISKA